MLSSIKTATLLTKFNITIKTPGNNSSPEEIPYKSIHVKYMLPNSDNQWNIIGIEPLIPKSNKLIEEISVHLCQVNGNTYRLNNIWYDDETYCRGARSMLIYQWISSLPLSNFQIADHLGFQLEKSKSLVLTVIYSNDQQIHNDQIGINFSISTLIPFFHVGTIFIGNKQRGIRFSCRSSDHPRLLYGIQPLFSKTMNSWWRIYIIRNRSFGRRTVELALDSRIYLKENKTGINIISADLFLLEGDYIIIECESTSKSICKFLIFYLYKNLQYKDSNENNYICQDNNYPDLFKLLPSKSVYETNEILSHPSNIEGTTIFSLIALLLLIIWISIIIGCIIMRRIRGLVNFRSESTSPVSTQKRNSCSKGRTAHDHKTIAEGDHIAQLDIEHMGLMNN